MRSGIARDTALGLTAAVISAPAALGVSVVLARWLDPASNGQVQAALSLLVVLGVLVQAGWVASSVVRLRRAGTRPAQVATHALGTVALQAVLAFGLGWLAWGPLQERVLVGAPDGVVWGLWAILPLGLWLQTLGGISRGLGHFGTWSVAQIADQVLRLLVLLALALLVPASPVVAMVGLAVAQALSTGWLLWQVLGATGVALELDAEEWRASASYGARSLLYTVAGHLHERVDLFLLAWLLGDPVEVAVYAIAVAVVNRVRMLPIALASALFPRLAERPAHEAARLAARACRHATLWVVTSSVVLGLAAPWLLPLVFGEVYARSVTPFLVLLPATAMGASVLLLGRWFQAVDRQGVNISSQAVGVVLNVGLNLWLIPRWGAVGAAAASLASYALQGAWVSAWFLWTTPCSARETFVIGRGDLEVYVTWLRPRS